MESEPEEEISAALAAAKGNHWFHLAAAAFMIGGVTLTTVATYDIVTRADARTAYFAHNCENQSTASTVRSCEDEYDENNPPGTLLIGFFVGFVIAGAGAYGHYDTARERRTKLSATYIPRSGHSFERSHKRLLADKYKPGPTNTISS